MKSAKFSWWDYTLKPLLVIFWEPFSKKRSHFWNWQRFSGITRCSQYVAGDKNAKDRRSIWRNLIQSNFGWKKVVYFDALDLEGFPYHLDYHVGFFNCDKRQYEICWLKVRGKVAVLRGNQNIDFFAIKAADGQPLKLRFAGNGDKRSLAKDCILI
ncbi:MAG: hypothetical protein WCO55_05640 [Candidatus Falkowbacteria bacterium]